MTTAKQPAAQSRAQKAGLVALVGAACASLCVPLVQGWEGKRNVAYQDIVGIWTICYGDTAKVRRSQVATDAECAARLDAQIAAHAAPVLACVPGLKDRPAPLSAAISLAYNIGPAAFCRSTAARRFNAGDLRGGCDAMLAWNKAGGKVVRGLANRRAAERALCLKGA